MDQSSEGDPGGIDDAGREVHYDAAGVVVRRGDGRVLVLRRGSEVRLPKGHVDHGEDHEETALRELAEESGYCDVLVVAELGTMTVTFDMPGEAPRRVVRDEHYFLGDLRSAATRPRTGSDLQFAPEWLDPPAAIAALTFDAEKQWVERAVDVLTRVRTPELPEQVLAGRPDDLGSHGALA